jgi:hypothetical protein
MGGPVRSYVLHVHGPGPAADSSLISFGLKFGTVIFLKRNILRTWGNLQLLDFRRSNLIFSGTTFKKEGNVKQRNYMFISTMQIDREQSRLNIWYMLFA